MTAASTMIDSGAWDGDVQSLVRGIEGPPASAGAGRSPLPDLWVRRGAALLVAGVAAYSSYQHQRLFAATGGTDQTSARLWRYPLTASSCSPASDCCAPDRTPAATATPCGPLRPRHRRLAGRQHRRRPRPRLAADPGRRPATNRLAARRRPAHPPLAAGTQPAHHGPASCRSVLRSPRLTAHQRRPQSRRCGLIPSGNVPPGEPPPAPNWTASPAPTATAAPSSPAGDAPDEYQSTPHSTPSRMPLGLETPPDSRQERLLDHGMVWIELWRWPRVVAGRRQPDPAAVAAGQRTR